MTGLEGGPSLDNAARKAILASLDRFIRDRLAPRAKEIDATAEFPRDLYKAVDELMFGNPEVDEYQVVLSTDQRAADVATVRIMPPSPLSDARRTALVETLTRELRHKIGIGCVVEVVQPGGFERSDYKVRRWIDRRALVLA